MIGKYKYDFNIPQDVKDLLNKLHTKYEAYIVGGCVRDLLLEAEELVKQCIHFEIVEVK